MRTGIILLGPEVLKASVDVLADAGVQFIGSAESNRFLETSGGTPTVALRISSPLLPDTTVFGNDQLVLAICDIDPEGRITLRGFEPCHAAR